LSSESLVKIKAVKLCNFALFYCNLLYSTFNVNHYEYPVLAKISIKALIKRKPFNIHYLKLLA